MHRAASSLGIAAACLTTLVDSGLGSGDDWANLAELYLANGRASFGKHCLGTRHNSLRAIPALAAFQKGLEAFPNHYALLVNYGTNLKEDDQRDKAKRLFGIILNVQSISFIVFRFR